VYLLQDMDLDAAFAAYMNAKDAGVTPGAETFCNLLSLTAGLGTQGSGQAMVRDREPPHNLEAAMVVYADMLSHSVEVPEASYTAIIRCCCINQQPFRGLQFYRDMQKLNITPKLRTFTSLLEALSSHDQHTVDASVTAATAAQTSTATTAITDSVIERGFALYEEMQRMYALEPSEKEFLCMLRLCLQSRDPRFYAVLTAFSETGIIPVSPELHRLLTAWFTTVVTGYQVAQSAILKDGTVAVNQEKLRSLDVDEAFRAEFLKQLESFAVTIDENKKIKVNNKVKEQQQIQAMKQLLQQGAKTSATAAQDAGPGAHSSSTAESAAEAATDSGARDKDRSKGATTPAVRQELWTDFTKYLRFHRETEPKAAPQPVAASEESEAPAKRAKYEHEQPPSTADTSKPARAGKSGFNIIVDGANVGYFRQNYLGAPNHVNYQHIDQLLQHLRALGHRPLLILHSRHCTKFMVPDEECEGIIQRWRSENCMYATPKGFNDDWFWLYAAVAHRCKVVTNDEMRDHHFQLLSPK
jgi:pentatricopeptide repeat protein